MMTPDQVRNAAMAQVAERLVDALSAETAPTPAVREVARRAAVRVLETEAQFEILSRALTTPAGPKLDLAVHHLAVSFAKRPELLPELEALRQQEADEDRAAILARIAVLAHSLIPESPLADLVAAQAVGETDSRSAQAERQLAVLPHAFADALAVGGVSLPPHALSAYVEHAANQVLRLDTVLRMIRRGAHIDTTDSEWGTIAGSLASSLDLVPLVERVAEGDPDERCRAAFAHVLGRVDALLHAETVAVRMPIDPTAN